MKRQIRSSVFETNSSSSHVIAVTKNDHILTSEDAYHGDKYWSDPKNEKLEHMYINKKDHTVDFYKSDLEFGRSPFQILSSFEDKVRYAIAAFCGDYSGFSDEEKLKNFNEIIGIAHEIFPELEDINLPMQDITIYTDINGNDLKDEDVFYNFDVSKESAFYRFYKDENGKKHPAKDSGYYYETPEIYGIDHQSATLLESFLNREHITLRDFLLNKKYIVVIDSDEICMWDMLKRSDLLNKDNIVFEYTTSLEWKEIKEKRVLEKGLEEDE